MSIPEPENYSFTDEQQRYLNYILRYTRLRGIPPSFADMESYFRVSAPTVNQMIKTLQKKQWLIKSPGVARSLFVNVPATLLLHTPEAPNIPYTQKQGEYLAFIQQYSDIRGFPPSYAEMEHYFRVTAPSVNQMLKNLEKKGLIEKQKGKPRSIKVTLPASQLPVI